VRRALLAAGAAALVAVAVYLFLVRDTTTGPQVIVPRAVATIGSGAEAVAVGPDGQVLAWLPLSEEAQLPLLPLSEPPGNGQLGGLALQQVHVLAAAPTGLRPYIEASHYGESGVDVELSSGIELRFGDASQAEQKWRAAAAVLADPTVTELDYVDLHAPRRPAVGGSGHTLPPSP
jgi:Cell division protein FtsQ